MRISGSGAISGSLFASPASNAFSVSCTADGRWNTSVDPHQTITVRATPVRFWKSRMSSISIAALSILVRASFRLGPRMLRT